MVRSSSSNGTNTNTHESDGTPTVDSIGSITGNTSVNSQGKKRLRSWVWDHIDKNQRVDPPIAVCRYCQKVFNADSCKNGTGQMVTHLRKQCHRAPDEIKVKDPKQMILSQSLDGMHALAYNPEGARNALAKMIMTDELPFRFVEGVGFKKLCEALQPRFNIPCRTTVAKDCMKIYEMEKQKIRTVLGCERVCLTTDTWTSIQNLSYMCLTAHFIDKAWKYNKKIINFCIVECHKGEVLGKAIETCLADWGIRSIFTVTVDNASANNMAISHLKKKTTTWPTTILDNEFMHVRCSAHILNLVVSDGLKESCDHIEKIRNAIKFVRSSPLRLSSFKKCVLKSSIALKNMLCLDVPTRWNSTFLMLQSVIKYQKAFELMEEDDIHYVLYFSDDNILGPPTATDFECASNLVECLKMFYDATLKFSGSSFVTSSTCFHELSLIENKINKLMASPDPFLSNMATQMKLKFTKYWSNSEKTNLLLYVATVLDPRRKLRYIKFAFNKLMERTMADVMVQEVKSAMVRLCKWFKDHEPILTMEEVMVPAPHDIMVPSNDAEAFEEEFKRQMRTEQTSSSISELDKYLDDFNLVTDMDFDVLGWWKMEATNYPVLSEVARAVLAVPVSTVASESTFSTSGRILDSFRSSLSPATVEALICTQNWLKTSNDEDAMDETDMVAIIDDIEI